MTSTTFWKYAIILVAALLFVAPNILAVSPNTQEEAIASLMANDWRQKRETVIVDPILSEVARARARDMADRNYFSHVNPDGVGPNYLVERAGYDLPDWWGGSITANNIESIAAGYTTAQEVWNAWLGSPTHRTHLLGENAFYAEQTAAGFGYAYNANSYYKNYWVVLTAPPESASYADFDANGSLDMIVQNQSTGRKLFWLLSGTSLDRWVYLPTWTADFVVTGAGDFDGDGNGDVVVQNRETGDKIVWYFRDTDYLRYSRLPLWTADLQISAVGDFNGDDHPDLALENRSTGTKLVWLMENVSIKSWYYLPTWNSFWNICAAGDLDGDGYSDVILQNSLNGARVAWLLRGSTYLGFANLPEWNSNWKVCGANDYDKDGNVDIVVQDSKSGAKSIWLMNGLIFRSSVSLPTWSPSIEIMW